MWDTPGPSEAKNPFIAVGPVAGQALRVPSDPSERPPAQHHRLSRMKSVGEKSPQTGQVSARTRVTGSAVHGSRSSASSNASSLLGTLLVAGHSPARLKRRLEQPDAIRSDRAGFGERPQARFRPLFLDAAMLLAASALARFVTLAAGNPLSPVLWDSLFFVLVMVGFGLRGQYVPRIRSNLLDEVRAIASATAIATMTVVSVRVALTDDIHLASQTALLWLLSLCTLSVGRAAPCSHGALGRAEPLHASLRSAWLFEPGLGPSGAFRSRGTARPTAPSPNHIVSVTPRYLANASIACPACRNWNSAIAIAALTTAPTLTFTPARSSAPAVPTP